MNFNLSEEQTMIQDSVARFVQDNYELEKRSTLAAGNPGFSREYWQTMAELGWLALPFEEADGGFGGNDVDGILSPAEVADCIVDGIAEGRFMILPHPEVATYFQRKASDHDRWIAGMQRFRRQLMGEDE